MNEAQKPGDGCYMPKWFEAYIRAMPYDKLEELLQWFDEANAVEELIDILNRELED